VGMKGLRDYIYMGMEFSRNVVVASLECAERMKRACEQATFTQIIATEFLFVHIQV
jgi:hypothetical protein